LLLSLLAFFALFSPPSPSLACAQEPDDPADPASRERRSELPPDGGAPPEKLEDMVVTATRREGLLFRLPHAGEVFDTEEVLVRRQSRTVPEVLTDSPSVMVQKTAHGQGSPYIRGFTGYQNVLLIDGIRLNNSVFRQGPNQYGSTVDHLAVDRMELIYGPSSVQYGSDAIGGVVNVLPRSRKSFEPGFHLGGRAYVRYSSAEDSLMERLEIEGNHGQTVGFLGGISYKDFGDLVAGRGSGELPETGYDQFDADFRIDWFPSDDLQWTIAWQHTDQMDVPRTHTTIDSVPFHGTEVGSELRRDHDQTRDLLYSRWTWTRPTAISDRISLTLSYHRQEEDRDRLRSGERRDLSGFDVETWGGLLQLEKETSLGTWTYGADVYYDDVGSYRRNYRDGTLESVDIQGPVGDDASYWLLGVYAQDEFRAFGVDWIAGARYTHAAADADRVDNPEVPGSDPDTPGNVISISDDFDNLVGSLRGSVPVYGEEWRVYFGVSQGFRAPNLSDLTSFDSTSVVEVPTEDLDPENYVAFELGLKARTDRLAGRLTGYYTILDDTIVRSPTGELVDGVPVVRKDNVGDGYVAGIEAEGSYRFHPDWSAFGGIWWMSGEVDQIALPSGEKTREPLDRMMPLSGFGGVRWEPVGDRFWIESFVRFADAADRLSLRDETDTQRIPPGGTPGWATINVRGGVYVSERLTVAAAVENIADKDYRIHGSGQNEAGTNFIASLEYRF
jgi:hemoglobin/transferrin/lactoferrin receptor protein